MIFLIYRLIWFANILLRIFATVLIKEIGLYIFLVVVVSFSGLGMSVMLLHRMSLAVFLPFLFCGKA
jgi:hypothetical protein